MSYFNFLSPDLQDEPMDESGNNPPSKGKTASQILDESTPGESESAPTYSQRRGEKSNKIFQTADQIIDKYADAIPDDVRNQYKTQVRANPDNAAKIIENYYKSELEKAEPKGQKLGEPTRLTLRRSQDPYDPEFANLEGHVRSYRGMLRGPEEKALSGKLEQTDLTKNLSELQNLKGQLDTVTKDIASAKDTMPEAVSGRGEEENKKTLAAKQQQAAAMSEHIRQLENRTTDYTQPQQQQPTVVTAPVKPPDPTTTTGSEAPVGEYLGALGVDKEKQVDTAQKALQIMGVHPDKLDDPVPTHAGLMRVLSALDPKGTFAQQLADEMAQAKQQDDQDKAQYDKEGKLVEGQMADTQKKLNSREDRMKQLYAQLNETPFMQTWPGIIMYVITGMLVGPGIATKIFGNLDNRRAIGNELAQLKFDIRRYDRQMEMQERHSADIRSAAIHRMQHREDRDLEYSRDLGKIVLQHNLILAREGQRHPDQAGAYKQLGTAYTRERNFMQDAQHRKDEAQRILSNDFADEGLKKKATADMSAAEQEIQQHKARATAIDETIKKMGGINLEEEGQ